MTHILHRIILLGTLSFTVSVISFAQQNISSRKNHQISADSAAKFINNLHLDAAALKIKGGMFHREAFDKILSQKNVIGIRYYYAKMDNGTPTLILVGVDSTGKDMIHGMIMERISPCPPYCDETSPFIK